MRPLLRNKNLGKLCVGPELCIRGVLLVAVGSLLSRANSNGVAHCTGFRICWRLAGLARLCLLRASVPCLVNFECRDLIADRDCIADMPCRRVMIADRDCIADKSIVGIWPLVAIRFERFRLFARCDCRCCLACSNVGAHLARRLDGGGTRSADLRMEVFGYDCFHTHLNARWTQLGTGGGSAFRALGLKLRLVG